MTPANDTVQLDPARRSFRFKIPLTPVLFLVGIILVALKVAGVLAAPWWVVLLPFILWAVVMVITALCIVGFLGMVGLAAIGALMSRY